MTVWGQASSQVKSLLEVPFKRMSSTCVGMRFKSQLAAVEQAKAAVPADWTIAQVQREDLDRFLFTRDDILLAIGQDGLVANLAKYVKEQPIVGLTPDPEATEGVLTPLRVEIVRVIPGLSRTPSMAMPVPPVSREPVSASGL